jgi:hypothetical protein
VTHAQVVALVDFDNAGTADTIGQVNGYYWNSWTPGTFVPLVDASDGTTPTNWGIFSETAAGANGSFVSGTDPAMGVFAALSVVEDALFLGSGDGTRNVILNGLNTNYTYDFSIFAARSSTEDRTTQFTISGTNSGVVSSQTSGIDLGGSGVNYNINPVSLAGIAPDSNGRIAIQYTVTQGSFGYFNAMQVTEVVPEPSTYALYAGLLALGAILYRRRRKA